MCLRSVPMPKEKSTINLTDSSKERKTDEKSELSRWRISIKKKEKEREHYARAREREGEKREIVDFWLHAYKYIYVYMYIEFKKIAIEIFRSTISVVIIVGWHEKFSSKTIIDESFEIYQ